MTAKQNRKPDLEAVLDEFAGLPGPPDAATLRAWTKDYPEFAHELIQFATDWVEMDTASAGHPVTAEEVDSVVNRTMSRVQAVLDAAERPELLTDLAADIRAAGHDFESFERSVGIDRSILDSLIARAAKPRTMPGLLVRSAAAALNRPLDRVRDYLRLPPQLAAAHKSRSRPAQTQVDFAMLVRDSKLPDPEKARWLEEPPDPALQE